MDGKGHVGCFWWSCYGWQYTKIFKLTRVNNLWKGKLLFAFDKAYKSIRQEKQAILVEGYMDVISAHNHEVLLM